jgi:hypothetical protein
LIVDPSFSKKTRSRRSSIKKNNTNWHILNKIVILPFLQNNILILHASL